MEPLESQLIENGKLLVAEPSIIGDTSFNRAVILLSEHTEEGTIGFVLNKPTELNLNDLIPEIDREIPVYSGGPVEQDSLFYIHQMPELIPGSIEIAHGLFWGGRFDVLQSLLENDLIRENEIKFFLGYSGWEAGQLETEIVNDTWILQRNGDKKDLINLDSDGCWKEKIEQLGGNYLLWANAPENPAYN
jgi:putative transcriptional regulator